MTEETISPKNIFLNEIYTSKGIIEEINCIRKNESRIPIIPPTIQRTTASERNCVRMN